MIVHADDFGITAWQARAILSLSDVCGGQGALNSVSIFANSPAFEEAARLARPFVLAGRAAERKDDNVASDHAAEDELSSGTAEPDARPGRAEASGGLSIGLHLNLVEGPCCADPTTIPLLVDERGMFRNDFVRLLMMSAGPQRRDLAAQTEIECETQIERFLQLFPEMRDGMRIDSHQHVHAIPLVFDALLAAALRAARAPPPLRHARAFRNRQPREGAAAHAAMPARPRARARRVRDAGVLRRGPLGKDELRHAPARTRLRGGGLLPRRRARRAGPPPPPA